MQPVRTLGKGMPELMAPHKSMPNLPRWTVSRDVLAPLGRSPPPRPREWNVHRDALAPLGKSPLLPEPQPNPMRVVPMTGPGFQPPCVLNRSSELRVDEVVAGKKTSFIVDTGAAFSLLTSYSGPTQDSELTIKGVSGVPLRPKISPPLLCQFGKLTLIHSFLIMPQCLMALLRRDLLSKLGVFIIIPPPRYSLYILHADGTWTVPIPHP